MSSHRQTDAKDKHTPFHVPWRSLRRGLFFRRGAHQVGVPRDMGEGLAQLKASCQHPCPTDIKHVHWLLCFADSTVILPQVHLWNLVTTSPSSK
ncbi:hypothetical protein BVRB_5g124620 [Beta vulgaris subsp. vulgaris]|nr:hypothetical protein BVRB_5g124620 [Beta vulgaris subsp. vulgaris]